MASQQIEIISQAQIKIVTKDSCIVQYTDSETKLFSDSSFKIEEQEIHIKDETELLLEEVDGNIKQLEGKSLKIEEKLDVTKDYCMVQHRDIVTKLFSDSGFKIEEEEVDIKDETELLLEEVDKNIKQLEGKSLKIEERLNVTKDSCRVQYTDIETLFSDSGFKIEEEEVDIKDESELLLEEVDKNSKNFEEGGRQQYCKKAFTDKVNLDQHLLNHSNVKKIKYNVHKHLVIHSPVRNFKCDICEKSFTKKSYLKRHLLIHSDDRNIKCDVCKKSFTQVKSESTFTNSFWCKEF